MEKSKNAELTFGHALPWDVAEVRQLLDMSKLPSEDIGEHIAHVLVARLGGRIVGVAGLELSGSSAVLRSLAVIAHKQGTSLGKELYGRIVDYAKSLGVKELGLLTTTAEGFFSKAGFTRIEKDQWPEYIRTTKEYRFYCPSTAVFMTKSI